MKFRMINSLMVVLALAVPAFAQDTKTDDVTQKAEAAINEIHAAIERNDWKKILDGMQPTARREFCVEQVMMAKMLESSAGQLPGGAGLSETIEEVTAVLKEAGFDGVSMPQVPAGAMGGMPGPGGPGLGGPGAGGPGAAGPCGPGSCGGNLMETMMKIAEAHRAISEKIEETENPEVLIGKLYDLMEGAAAIPRVFDGEFESAEDEKNSVVVKLVSDTDMMPAKWLRFAKKDDGLHFAGMDQARMMKEMMKSMPGGMPGGMPGATPPGFPGGRNPGNDF